MTTPFSVPVNSYMIFIIIWTTNFLFYSGHILVPLDKYTMVIYQAVSNPVMRMEYKGINKIEFVTL